MAHKPRTGGEHPGVIARTRRALRTVLDAPSAVPVLVYHSVGPDNGHPVWRHLSLPVEVFEAQMAWLRREGYHPVSLYDVHAHVAKGASLPERAIALTFDDGFLDNWVYAHPILERYGFRATLFLCPAFVQEGTGARSQAHSAPPSDERLPWWGYLRWDEVRAMAGSGVFDIQAHGLTHRQYFTGPRIVDYMRPDTPDVWWHWNIAPHRQPYSLTESGVPESAYGSPVYEHAEAMLAPQYAPDPAEVAYVQAMVAAGGGADFFQRPDWRATLDDAVAARRREYGENGRCESHGAYRARVRDELRACRTLLQERVGMPADFLCWPANQCTDEAHRLALEVGYTATTCLGRPNVPGANPTRIGRTYFGQDEQVCRVGRPWVTGLRFRGTVQLAGGRRTGYPKLFLANRLLEWYDRPGRRAAEPEVERA